MWIDRDFSTILRHSAAQRPAVVLTGSRQTGKTALIRACFPHMRFVSLDLPAEADAAERDPSAFLAANPPPLIIDEVQYAPGIFRYLKRVIDERRAENGLFVLTGSQKFTLMHGVSDSLAGRADILELEPLSLHELATAGLPTPLPETMLRGGYPELHARSEVDTTSFYRSYVASYLERDVRNLLSVVRLRDFERFLRACALRSGQLVNKAELARDVGISATTANEWLSVLEASNQVTLLEPWFANRLKSTVKTPKLYIRDSGILCFLLNISTVADLLRSPLLGSIWETFAFIELRKKLAREGRAESLFFWRDRQREVDFLVHHGGRFDLFEAKWSERPSERDAASLRAVAALLGHVDTQTIITRAERGFPMDGGVAVAPLRAIVGG